MIDYSLLKEYLFRLEPETAHDAGIFTLKAAQFFPPLLNYFIERNFVLSERLTQTIFDRQFLNPVGMAAGFDKNGEIVGSAAAFGFGYVEVGTVTPKAQEGNERPRLWRFPEYESLQNAFGFNNQGAVAVAKRVTKLYPFSLPIGANIGKNKLTADKDAVRDYLACCECFKDICDYMAINISSPNTKGLRELQNSEFVGELFSALKAVTTKPLLLKIAPDMFVSDAVELCVKAVESGAAGIIATNTTTDYSLLPDAKDKGGISGQVLAEKSFAMFDAIASELFGKTVLISVGGIGSAEEAYRRIKAGASLLQLYTAMIYGGPKAIKKINEGLIELLNSDGYTHISEAIGVARR